MVECRGDEPRSGIQKGTIHASRLTVSEDRGEDSGSKRIAGVPYYKEVLYEECDSNYCDITFGLWRYPDMLWSGTW